MAHLPHIGTIELVSLLNGRFQHVPAKVDTGADSSSIWASQISEENGKLSFVLFDKTSPFYNGEVITTSDYRLTSVKNSFGHSENRYKTPLLMEVAGKTIKANFTLANRQNNRYPVLIGRRTLSGKFLVDVSRRNTKKTFKVLVLSTKISKVTDSFVSGLQKNYPKLDITYATYKDLCFNFEQASVSVTLRVGGQDLADFDIVHFKVTAGHWDIAAAAAHYLEQRGVIFIDKAVRYFPSTSKLYQYMILTGHDIAVPNSIFLMPLVMSRSYSRLVAKLGLPFVLKDIHGKKGQYNYLINDHETFKKACQELLTDGVQAIAQAYIENDGDYRILVLGGRIELVIARRRQAADTHLNNTSQGAEAKLMQAGELSHKVQSDSILAAKIMGRQVAGVDMVQDKTSGIWYCLEVNDGPQIASGSFRAEKNKAFAAYLERVLNS